MTKANIGRGIVGLLSLFFMSTGLMLMFSPAGMLGHMFIEPVQSVGGLSSIRAVWGGTIFALWATVMIGAIRSNKDYMILGLGALLMTLVGRVVGLINDGSFPEVASTLMPTVIAITLLLIAFKLMKQPIKEAIS